MVKKGLIIADDTFRFDLTKVDDDETLVIAFSEHIEELRQRLLQSLLFATIIIALFFIDIQWWVELLESPVKNIKFIQLAPGEYFTSTIKIAIYAGLLFSLPILTSQIIFYIVPGLTENEKKIILPLLIMSTVLFLIGITFSYKILIPAALGFFISYSSDFVEPIWSFDEYLNFTTLLFLSTGITFQIPLLQIILGLTNIVSSQQMLSVWKYILVGSTIVGAILTPSTDPITQICLSLAILVLYFAGILFLKFYRK
jgi:sec-independent protein translocase protein TatC